MHSGIRACGLAVYAKELSDRLYIYIYNLVFQLNGHKEMRLLIKKLPQSFFMANNRKSIISYL